MNTNIVIDRKYINGYLQIYARFLSQQRVNPAFDCLLRIDRLTTSPQNPSQFKTW